MMLIMFSFILYTMLTNVHHCPLLSLLIFILFVHSFIILFNLFHFFFI